MRKLLLLCVAVSYSFLCMAQSEAIGVYPTHWWVGMKWNKVQIMLHSKTDKNMWSDKSVISLTYPGVKLLKVHKPENRKYIFLDLEIAPTAKPGKIKIDFNFINLAEKFSLTYELKTRQPGNGIQYAQGVTSKDLMYLIMPDRFANGHYSNDRVEGMKDQSLNRDTVFNRHGGDLKGVESKLDYLSSLGVTAIWLNPVIENDMPDRTEHGYAFTNHYKVDARLGGDLAYHSLVKAAHQKGIKIIQDAVYNHVGSQHFTVLDPPMNNWLHHWDSFTQTSYKDQVLFDPYASAIDKKIMSDGWFVKPMPDLDQNNLFVANFLIQHALWTMQEFGIDGWRIDTYAYNDLNFMNRCNAALEADFPKVSLFGETWVHGVINQSYFCQNNYSIPFKSNLQAVTDFQLLWGITDAMTKDYGWTDGVNKLYTNLAQDFVYKDPMRNVIFLDNHDLARFYSVIGEDIVKYKAAMDWLLTCRGIPQLYYGNEILMTGFTSPSDGYVRKDFMGGWKEDSLNKFTASGRTLKENEVWNYIATLANFRKTSTALTTGKMMQYIPIDDGVYAYFRYDDKQTIFVVLNTAKTEKRIIVNRYNERTKGFSKIRNVHTGEVVSLTDFTIPAKESRVFELLK
ncbi:MAG TPA: alpha-amylase family glycosyl hydrolase [Ferruginibacter sp.]|nr:alpha-amylase family glycosyl hydrolase [Ferruginibacter sp.]HRE62330.1 alpha-amylase family glycosyl hydrolase [Ferruginibacter sp.]